MNIFKNANLQIWVKAGFLFLDIIFINMASILSLFFRFNMNAQKIDISYFNSILQVMLINTTATVIIFYLFRLYSSLWRYAGIKEFTYILGACASSSILNVIIYHFALQDIFQSYFILYPFILFLLICLSRFSYRIVKTIFSSHIHGSHTRNTMIVGGGEAGVMILKELTSSRELDAKVCCIIDDNESKQEIYIQGIKVVGGRDCIMEYAEKFNINEIIIAMPSANKKEVSEILNICKNVPNCNLKILPGIYQLVKGDVSVSNLRNVQIEDLLGREVTKITTEKVSSYVSGKVVMVTGGGGSIGSELCRQLAANGVSKLIIFDIYENNAYDIEQELKRAYPLLDIVALIGSVRNSRKLDDVFRKYRPQIVYHAAAHKHVPLMETSPNEAIKNNVFGTYKTAFTADKYGVEKFVLISTDKAVNPTNIMGASKRMCEMIVQLFSRNSKTEFAAVRFGNVLGSNGSVIPLFKKQLEEGGPITVTHPDIIRYFMTIPEAVSLVLQAGASAKGGEIFVLDMGNPVKIVDLAKNLIRLSGYTLGEDMEIKYTGLRPGEKLYEELLMSEEGLESTDNHMIHIGKPIIFDEDEFLENLQMLYKEAYAESDHMKEIVHKIVPTYNLRPEDREDNIKYDQSLDFDFKDASPHLPVFTK